MLNPKCSPRPKAQGPSFDKGHNYLAWQRKNTETAGKKHQGFLWLPVLVQCMDLPPSPRPGRYVRAYLNGLHWRLRTTRDGGLSESTNNEIKKRNKIKNRGIVDLGPLYTSRKCISISIHNGKWGSREVS